jgi:toxin FitB
VPDVLIDTDIFIDHLRGAHRLTVTGDRVSYSVITRCELCAGRNVDEAAVRLLLAPFAELRVDPTIAERAGRIRRQTDTRIADALIAATALEHGLVVITRNVRHFSRVPDLRVQPPQ